MLLSVAPAGNPELENVTVSESASTAVTSNWRSMPSVPVCVGADVMEGGVFDAEPSLTCKAFTAAKASNMPVPQVVNDAQTVPDRKGRVLFFNSAAICAGVRVGLICSRSAAAAATCGAAMLVPLLSKIASL